MDYYYMPSILFERVVLKINFYFFTLLYYDLLIKLKDEIIIYQADETTTRIEVRIGEETVWLNRQQIATLFGRDVKTIGKHINNIFSEAELNREVVVAKFATTTQHGAMKMQPHHIGWPLSLSKCSPSWPLS